MQLIVVTGLSGSGKSIALRQLEDLGYYCIDNLPGNYLVPSQSISILSAETYWRFPWIPAATLPFRRFRKASKH